MNTNLKIIGEHPFATDADGNLKSRIATVFPITGEMVTVPGIHATQHFHYTDILNSRRAEEGRPPLTDEEADAIWTNAVDLIITDKCIQIRPVPEKMKLALRADKCLQTIASKRSIRFLRASDPKVQQAIRETGEYWRICPYPQLKEEIISTIENSKIAINGERIYHYCAETGSRHLTYQSFKDLEKMDDASLRLHLIEIRDYSTIKNKGHHPEIAFFAASSKFGAAGFKGFDFEEASPGQLRIHHKELSEKFKAAVSKTLQRNNPNAKVWRDTMFACLMNEESETLARSVISDLTSEFFRMIRWLPGGRIENGRLIFDSMFNDRITYQDDKKLAELCDAKIKGFIVNYIREFGNIEYVNIGWVLPSIRHLKKQANGHRVYIAEVKHLGADKPVIRILRIQQWGMREHLDYNKNNANRDMLYAFEHAMEYTEYTQDRRLACWDLGMPLPGKIDTRSLVEVYAGRQKRYHGRRIRTTYYERDFIKGLASDKIPDAFLKEPAYAISVARLLGQAAAPNMVVGRTIGENSTKAFFDNGDEMILSNSDGHPHRIVVADHAGTFHDYTNAFSVFAADYALPVTRRLKKVSNPEAFTETYLTSLSERLLQMKDECHQQKEAFNTLFQSSKQGPKTFSDRWAKALDRLENTDVPKLIACIRREIENLKNQS